MDAGGSVKHVLRVGWLVFWQEAERGKVRFSFFSPKSDLLELITVAPFTTVGGRTVRLSDLLL